MLLAEAPSPPHVLARKETAAAEGPPASDDDHGNSADGGGKRGVRVECGGAGRPLASPSRPMWVVELQRKLAEKEAEMGRLRRSVGRLEAESKLLTDKLRAWEGYREEPRAAQGEAG